MTLGSLLLFTALGLAWAVMRVSGIPLLANLSAAIINLLRGIPIIVILFFLYCLVDFAAGTVDAVFNLIDKHRMDVPQVRRG